jgi:hypothetical protein
MIETNSKPTVPNPTGSTIKPTSFNSHNPPNPEHKPGIKKSTLIVLIVLFLAAIGGGLFAYINYSQTSNVDVTQSPETYAWRPYSVAGTCSGVKVIGHVEQAAYDFNFTFVLSQPGRTASFSHTFRSSPVSSGHKIDEDVMWSALGAEGITFGSLLQTGDTVNWNVDVTYTLAGSAKNEKYADSFKIFDTTCSEQASPTPTSAPSGTPVGSQSPSPTPSRTPVPSATGTPTASPSEPPVGGPSATPTSEPTATPTPGPTNPPSTPTDPPQSTEVAQTQSEELPKAGVPYGILFMGIGALSLGLSAAIAFSKRRF